MVTVWAPQAIAELKKAYKYISQDSPQNAKKVLEEIIALADRLPEQPEMFPPDKYNYSYAAHQ
jgi:plasmid stabilization system protein ParE